ncbi:hypothetical protein GCM10023321_47770 [Pseudonocardia eucalypti]|uniref:PhoU domain-containing protein n=1 Tax=Pseudonocardia eucalypti TaxID=648755 RepID=A0ABP9QI50_9PSEU
MQHASHALLHEDLKLACRVIDTHEQIARRGTRCARLCLLEPLTTDRRIAVAAMTASDKIVRMGELDRHIAELVCRLHPQPVIPGALREQLVRMSQLALRSGRHLEQAITAPVGASMPALQRMRDELDWLQRHLLDTLERTSPPYPPQSSTDVASLARWFERFAAHAIFIARQLDNTTSDAPHHTPTLRLAPPARKSSGAEARVRMSGVRDFWAEDPLTRFYRNSGSAEWILAKHQRGEYGECLRCSTDHFVEYPCTQLVHANQALRPTTPYG